MICSSLGFTGTREGMTLKQQITLKRLLLMLHPNQTHSGDCLGADEQFVELVFSLLSKTYRIGHPCTLERLRAFSHYDKENAPKAPLERNRAIVDACELLVACPKEASMQLRSGTWATVRYAFKVGRPAVVVLPSGEAAANPVPTEGSALANLIAKLNA